MSAELVTTNAPTKRCGASVEGAVGFAVLTIRYTTA